MTDQNPLLERLAAGGAVSCLWMALGSVAAAEVMAEARPDAVMFDTQHGLWDKQNLYSAFAAKQQLNTDILRNELKSTQPLSVTRSEDVTAIREWARTRAVSAD